MKTAFGLLSHWHAMIILVVMQAIDPVICDRPLPALLLSYMRLAHYIPFAVTLAGGLNADRLILLKLEGRITASFYDETDLFEKDVHEPALASKPAGAFASWTGGSCFGSRTGRSTGNCRSCGVPLASQ